MAGAKPDKRIYLVVIDDSPEARVALQFAARRAAKTCLLYTSDAADE